MNLSENFTLAEFVFSTTAQRLGFNNTPNAAQIEKLRYLASRLEEVRTLVGPLHVNSGYRCLKLNRAIGSKDTSQHLKCEAADLTSLHGNNAYHLCDAVAGSGIGFDQLIFEFGSWMHISFVENKQPRGSVLTINKHGTFTGLTA